MKAQEFPQSNLTPVDSISIEHAIAWTGNWQKLFPNHCKAFLIPISDVLNLLLELHVLEHQEDGSYKVKPSKHKNSGIRAYMAIGDTDDDGDIEERLVMVGAVEEVAESNIYIDQIAKRKDGANVILSGSGAFDLTTPCPNNCDPGSSLYH